MPGWSNCFLTQAPRPAIVTTDGMWTYRDLDDASARAAATLLAGRTDLNDARIALLAPPSFEFIAALSASGARAAWPCHSRCRIRRRSSTM